MKPFVASLIAVLFACGCASTLQTREQVSAASKRVDDDYRKTFSVEAPWLDIRDGYNSQAMLRCGSESGPTPAWYQLYVSRHGAGWSVPKEAFDRSGSALQIRSYGVDHNGGYLAENFAVLLKRDYLDRCAETGLDIRVDGQQDFVIQAPAWYVRGFLDAVERQAR